MANVATTGNIYIDDEFIDDEFEPLIIPPDASLDERLRILTVHSENYRKHLAASITKTEQQIRVLDQRLIQIAEEGKTHAQKLFSSKDKQTAQPVANITSEFTTLRKEGSILATQVGSQQGELKSQESSREEVVSEVELPTGGDKPKCFSVESQPYTEAVHGEDGQQNCSSDNKIVYEQIPDFSTDPAIYVATNQMHGGQDAAHVDSLDNQKQVHDQCNYDSATGRHDHAKGQEHDPLNYQLRHGPPYNHQLSLGHATGRLGESGHNHGQLNYQLSCGLGKPTCGFFDQFRLNFFISVSRPSGGFDICGGYICNPPCKNDQNNYSSGQFVLRDCKFEYHQYKLTLVYNYLASNFLQKKFVYDTKQCIEASQYDAWKENRGKQIFDMPIFKEEINSSNFGDSKYDLNMEPIYDEYDDDYALIIGSKNHKQEFKFFEALDKENLDQQVVKYKGQPAVASSEDTMFYDMVVGDKADLGTLLSPKLQLKISLRQPTKIFGGQYYSFYEPNFSQVFDVKYLCCFPASFHKKSFHVINFDTSELGVKHRWPPPWPSRG